jgi:hypothetical protein
MHTRQTNDSTILRCLKLALLPRAFLGLVLGIVPFGTWAAQSHNSAETKTSGVGSASPGNHKYAKVCPDPAPGHVACHSWVEVDGTTRQEPQAGTLKPLDLQSAYSVNPNGGAGVTVGHHSARRLRERGE